MSGAVKPATPLPWEFDAEPGSLSGWIGQPDTEEREGTVVASPEPHGRMAMSARKNATKVRVLDERSKQDAAYIVHAANAYPKLVEALRTLIDADREGALCNDQFAAAIDTLRELGEA